VRKETLRRFTIGLGAAGGVLALGVLAFFGRHKIKTIADEIGEAVASFFNQQTPQTNAV
jgi:hypothetical protein